MARKTPFTHKFTTHVTVKLILVKEKVPALWALVN